MVAATDFKFKYRLKKVCHEVHELFSRRFKQMYTDFTAKHAKFLHQLGLVKTQVRKAGSIQSFANFAF
ncbi:hypothetical protein, partial [Flavobacterium circumlabens]|uniref:hypothetical protein n=1 Tax=Flavobacterium circumlabens TaxID=2133765 RepID=UPI001EE7F978